MLLPLKRSSGSNLRLKKTVKDRGPLDWVPEQEGVAYHHSPLIGKRVDFLIGVLLLLLLGNLGRERGYLNPQNDTTNSLCDEDIEFIACLHSEEYTTQMPDKTTCINQQTLGSVHDHFEIIAPICIYLIGYSFSLQGFAREVFRQYQLDPRHYIPIGGSFYPPLISLQARQNQWYSQCLQEFL